MGDTNKPQAHQQAARGLGRYFRRTGVARDQAVQYVTTLYPQFVGSESDIARGWNAEKAGR